MLLFGKHLTHLPEAPPKRGQGNPACKSAMQYSVKYMSVTYSHLLVSSKTKHFDTAGKHIIIQYSLTVQLQFDVCLKFIKSFLGRANFSLLQIDDAAIK
jgi:hypothetical protein